MKNAQLWKLGVVRGMFMVFVGAVYALGGGQTANAEVLTAQERVQATKTEAEIDTLLADELHNMRVQAGFYDN